MNRVLGVCNTHYQVLVAIQLKLTVYNDSEFDIIITDIVSNAANVVEMLRKIGIFSKVMHVKVAHMSFTGFTINDLNVFFKKAMDNDINNVLTEKNRYKEYLFSNIGGYGTRLGRYVKKYSPKVKFSMFEDGLSSYSNLYGNTIKEFKRERVNKLNLKKFASLIKRKILGAILAEVSTYWVFRPDVLVWDCDIAKQIPSIENNKEELKNILNQLYDYENMQDKEIGKVIFFEESYVADGIDISDVDLVKTMESIYSKENIFIKRHPRSKINRFGELGYTTNKDYSVPWEVIALNMELNDKVLVTISSTAVANTFLLLNSDCKMIFKVSCIENIENERIKYTIEVIRNINKKYPNSIEVC